MADMAKEGPLKIPNNPRDGFNEWFEAAVAANIEEPSAMTLATCVNNKPSARIVLYKGIYDNGFMFVTNYESRKSQELTANPQAALVFLWKPLGRQIRIEGRVHKLSRKDSEAYFGSRERGSQIGAWASPQS